MSKLWNITWVWDNADWCSSDVARRKNWKSSSEALKGVMAEEISFEFEGSLRSFNVSQYQSLWARPRVPRKLWKFFRMLIISSRSPASSFRELFYRKSFKVKQKTWKLFCMHRSSTALTNLSSACATLSLLSHAGYYATGVFPSTFSSWVNQAALNRVIYHIADGIFEKILRSFSFDEWNGTWADGRGMWRYVWYKNR